MIIRGGRVVDPATGTDSVLDVRIEHGVISAVAPEIVPEPGETLYDASGLLVSPGWIDAHSHLRDPGVTWKEDFATGARSALAGGITRTCAMPNTNPPVDSAGRVRDAIERSAPYGLVVHPVGTISVGRAGAEIAPLEAMAAAGAVGFSDDGDSTRSVEVMRQALLLSKQLNLPIMVHCEDPDMARGGSMHRGAVSLEIGDAGIPAEAEESYIARDIALAEETGGWLHVLHVSTVRGAELVAAAQRRGVNVTAEVMTHHMLLTDEWVAGRRRFAGESVVADLGRIDPLAKVNPPLRPEADALGLRDVLRAGTFAFVATDHAPHAEKDKPARLLDAAFGMSGFELAIPSMGKLVDAGVLSWLEAIAHFTCNPARTLHLPGGSLAVGGRADVTVIDPAREWLVSEETLYSKSKNTPLLGMWVRGRAVLTISGERCSTMSWDERDAALVLEDGRVFRGVSFGATCDVEGEAVFTTSMTGYQEVATDPSFRGQIVCMTYPLIGNYGVTPDDDQSRRPWISGMVVREYCDEPSNWRSADTFAEYLRSYDIPAISGVDTRALTRHIRSRGAMRALICGSIGDRSLDELRDRARHAWSPSDANVVADVSVPEERALGAGQLHVVLIDCGVKENILASIERRNVRVTVVPFDTPYAEIAALQPDGVLTSPGPGDPENVHPAIETVREIVEHETPYLGVCLGHQLLGLAIGASTSKLKFGHRGGNHPVLDLDTGRVHITSQNHGYQVDAASVPTERGWRVAKINLNDRSVEGLSHNSLPIFSVQYHPEGSPGPQDNQYVFDEFIEQLRVRQSRGTAVSA